MDTNIYIPFTILAIGWAIITIPTRVLFPYLVSKQLASKDRRLQRLLEKIPFIRVNKRADSIEKLMKKPQNIRFMATRYPVMFKWYTFSVKWSTRIIYVFAGLVLISQLIGVAKFAADPKGEMQIMREAAEQFKKND